MANLEGEEEDDALHSSMLQELGGDLRERKQEEEE